MNDSIFGFFTEASQHEPAYDPGRSVLCPFCLNVLGDGDVRCTSLLVPGTERSYFYRYHFGCHDEKAAEDIEGSLIDSLSEQSPCK
jgi:hypothetical protein